MKQRSTRAHTLALLIAVVAGHSGLADSCAALLVALGGASVARADAKNKILEVTVGTPTTMSGVVYQNSSSLAGSRTGAVAAFYPRRKPTPALVYTCQYAGTGMAAVHSP